MQGRTEGEVDDDVVCAEVGAYVARLARKVRIRRPLSFSIVNVWFFAGDWCQKEGRAPTQLPVLTDDAPFLTSLGTEPSLRDQNQILMNEFVRSMAYQPPPALLNAGP